MRAIRESTFCAVPTVLALTFGLVEPRGNAVAQERVAEPVPFEFRSAFERTPVSEPPQAARREGLAAQDVYALPVHALGAIEGRVVADIGAGRGKHVKGIAARVGSAGKLIATEISDDGCEALRSMVSGLDNAEVVQGTRTDVGLETASIDVALLSDVYQFVALLDGRHGQDKHAFLNSLFRSMKPGGEVVVTYVTSSELKQESSRNALIDGTSADFTAYGFEPGRRWLLDGPHWPVAVLEFRVPERGPYASGVYMGREIAQTMHWEGGDWLLRSDREKEEASASMLDALGVQTGWTVADFGCGNGYHALELAKRVGASGRVLGVDIQPEMLAMLSARAMELEVENVEPLLGAALDAPLPPASCDLILLADVYHELSHPVPMLTAIRRALKPEGRVALLEFRAEDPEVPIKPEHKMSKRQAIAELEANGFRLDAEFDELPWQHLLFFRAAGD